MLGLGWTFTQRGRTYSRREGCVRFRMDLHVRGRGTYSWREVCVRFSMCLHAKGVCVWGWGGEEKDMFTRKVLSNWATYYWSHIRPVNFNSFPAHGCYSCFIIFFLSTWLVIMILMLLRKEITLQACQLILFFFYSRNFEGFPWSLALGQSTIKGEWSSQVIDNCMDALQFSFKTSIYRAAEYETMVPPVSTNLFLIYFWVRKAIVKRTLKEETRGDLVTWAACISQVRYKMYKTFISSLFCHAKSVTFKSKSKFQNCVIRRQERCSRGNVLLNTSISANSKDSEHEFNKWTYGRLNLSHISTASVMPLMKSKVRLFWGVKGHRELANTRRTITEHWMCPHYSTK